MAYLQVDLDSLRRAEAAAGLLGISAHHLLGGLVKLWAFSFAEQRSTVTLSQLAGFMACKDPGLPAALADFGFVQLAGESVRVKGTDRYERLREARSAGGKAALNNLRQNTGSSRKPAGDQPEASREAAPAATGSLIRDPRSESKEDKSQRLLSVSTDCQSVFEAYKLVVPDSRWTKGKDRIVRARLAEGFSPADLALVPQGARLDPWPERPQHMGFEKIFRPDNCEKFIAFAKNGPPKPQASLQDLRTKPVRAEDMDWSNVPLGRVS